MSRPRKSTMIRNERKATAARKRAAFDFQAPIKKPGIAPGFYNSDATKALPTRLEANFSHSTDRSMNDEICR
jgi:hypothetical protein